MVKAQPNSKHCFVCGLESPVGLKLRFYDNGVDEIRCTYLVKESYNGYPGVVHGGILAAMLDEAGGRALMIHDHSRFMMTARLEIRYRQPTPVETELTLIGRVVKDKGRVAEAASEIRLPDGAVSVEATMTLVAFPVEGDLDALGWRVYPDDELPAVE